MGATTHSDIRQIMWILAVPFDLLTIQSHFLQFQGFSSIGIGLDCALKCVMLHR
jgi:hypothetical protein